MNEAEVLDGLSRLGLDDKERRFYLAALELPGASVTDLAAKASVGRTHGYDLLERLAGRGLLKKVPGAGGKRVVAEDPGILVSEWRRAGESLDQLVPVLRTMSSKSGQRPSVRLYEGRDEIDRAVSSFLDAGPPVTKIVLGQGPERACMPLKALQRIAKRSLLAARELQMLLTDETALPDGLATPEENVVKVRRAPQPLRLPLSVLLQDQQALCISAGSESYAMWVKSRDFVAIGRMLFEQAWAQSVDIEPLVHQSCEEPDRGGAGRAAVR